MKVPNGAPAPQSPTFLNNRALSLPGNNITFFVSYRQTHEKRAGGGSPCHIPGEVSCSLPGEALFPPPCPLSNQEFWHTNSWLEGKEWPRHSPPVIH